MKRIQTFDLLRGFAILAMVVIHRSFGTIIGSILKLKYFLLVS